MHPALGSTYALVHARHQPQALAVHDLATGQRLTYLDLAATALALQQHWRAQGVAPGDRIAVLADNHPALLVLFSACQALGAVLVPLNTRLAAQELGTLLAATQPRCLYHSSAWATLAQSLADGPSLEPMEPLLGLPRSETLPEAPPHRPEQPLMLLFTSGSTGAPKGVVYTHGMLYYNALNTHERFGLGPADVALHLMPPFHTGGWHVLPTPTLFAGGALRLLPRFEAGPVLAALTDPAVSTAMLVPTMCRILTEDPAWPAARLSHLRFLVVGGEALSVPLIETWHAKGVAIRQGYGLTEAGPGITSLPAEDTLRKRGSIGTPNRHLQVRVVDVDGNACPPGTPGELQLSGPVVTPGYWQHPEATAAAFTPDGWLRTGDVVTCDPEGYYYVVDRIKHLYISGGENVYPAEVEAALRHYPGLADIGIVGVPDAQWGEVGVAFLVWHGPGPFDWEALRAWAKDRLASYKLPKRYHLVEGLPLGASGKIDRQALKRRALEG